MAIASDFIDDKIESFLEFDANMLFFLSTQKLKGASMSWQEKMLRKKSDDDDNGNNGGGGGSQPPGGGGGGAGGGG